MSDISRYSDRRALNGSIHQPPWVERVQQKHNYPALQYLITFFRLQKTHDVDHDDDLEKDERDNNGSVLNLSQSQSDIHDDSVRSDSDIGEPDIATDDEMDYNDSKDNSIIKEKAEEDTKPGSMFQMMNQIQSLIKMTVEKAKQEEEKNTIHQKSKCQFTFGPTHQKQIFWGLFNKEAAPNPPFVFYWLC